MIVIEGIVVSRVSIVKAIVRVWVVVGLGEVKWNGIVGRSDVIRPIDVIHWGTQPITSL